MVSTTSVLLHDFFFSLLQIKSRMAKKHVFFSYKKKTNLLSFHRRPHIFNEIYRDTFRLEIQCDKLPSNWRVNDTYPNLIDVWRAELE